MTADSSDEQFVIDLGRQHARAEHARRPNLTPHALEELAYEAWWNGPAYTCSDEGMATEDGRLESLYEETFVAEYNALRAAAGPEPQWKTRRLAKLRADLQAAGVSKQRLERVDTFISDAGLDEGHVRGVDQFCELFEYVFGVRDRFPTSWKGGKPYFEVDDTTWQALFFPVLDWDEVELRLCTWIWQLQFKKHELNKEIVYKLAPKDIRATPGEPVFDKFRELVLQLGALESNLLGQSVASFMYATMSETRELTSYGRYILAAGFDAVWPLATKHRRVSYYADLLLHHAPEIFDAHVAQFEKAVATSEGWKLDLTEAMLHADKDKWRDTVLRWAPTLTSPSLRSHMAIYLCRAFGDDYKELVLDLTGRAIADFGDDDNMAAQPLLADPLLAPLAGHPNSSVKLCLVATVLRAYGGDAFDAIKEYRYRNEGWMIRYYELLGRFLPGHSGALELLIAGLMKQLPDDLGGMLTYHKYLERLVQTLSAYDLTPYEQQLAKRFADLGDPTLQAIIASIVR